jgi:glycosyltransferase involved in cell wall biosynthesis
VSRGQAASIIISSYNYARFLNAAIDSALAQTHPAEVIVVDDGSTDASRSVIEGYGARVTAILKENGGQASAFNAGLKAANGDAVIFLDSDDVLMPTAVSRAVELLGEGGVSKVHWPLLGMDEAGQPSGGIFPDVPLKGGDFAKEVGRFGPKGYAWPPTSGNAWARGFLEHVFPIPESRFVTCPDLYLCSTAPLLGRVGCVEVPQGYWRVHGANNTSAGPLERRIEFQMRIWDYCFDVIERLCAARGIPCDRASMTRASWKHQVYFLSKAITEVVPRGESFILIDEGGLALNDVVWDRRPIALDEGDAPWGRYWGPPPDDRIAVKEFEKRRAAGATYAVFVPQTFWWLEQYDGFRQHLEREYRRIRRTDELIVFDLRK